MVSSKSRIAQRIDRVIECGLKECLKEEGYTKRGRTWHRRDGRGIKVVNVQASSSNMGACGKFTLNLGVYFPEVGKLGFGFAVEGPPHEYDCTVRRRIGSLMPQKSDHWWKIGWLTRLKKLGHEVAATWRQYGKPWLDRTIDLAAAKQELTTQGYLKSAAVVCLLLNQRQEAVELVKKALSTANPQHIRGLKAWAAKRGLLDADPQHGANAADDGPS